MSDTNKLYEKLEKQAVDTLRSEIDKAYHHFKRSIKLHDGTVTVKLEVLKQSIDLQGDSKLAIVLLNESEFNDAFRDHLVAIRKDAAVKKRVDEFLSAVKNQHTLIDEIMSHQQQEFEG